MDQNTIAIIWDFDKTLAAGYMQEPIFEKYGVDGAAFWKEVNSLEGEYAKRGIKINKETIYLNHMITCVEQGIFAGLNKEILLELGKELKFYAGVPDIFKILKGVTDEPKYKKHNIHVEHYIISTGITAMISGSVVKEHVDDIWGCEFIEDPIRSELDIKIAGAKKAETGSGGTLKQLGYIIDNTSKTRAIFEINKGSNKHNHIDVNSKIDKDKRRVPFENMIYIADGPSDVPVFSIIKQYGGKTFAIYPEGDMKAYEQVDRLRDDKRIDHYAKANYEVDSEAYNWLVLHTKKIAVSIFEKIEREIRESASSPPGHITE